MEQCLCDAVFKSKGARLVVGARRTTSLGQSAADLPLAERAGHYRELALDALWLAERARETSSSTGYFKIACGWQALALELELSLDDAVQVQANSDGNRADQILELGH